MVFTIEPGIYFIPSLLAHKYELFSKWQATSNVNWEKIERFSRYGGIRIEDNVYVTKNGVENLTRDAFQVHE